MTDDNIHPVPDLRGPLGEGPDAVVDDDVVAPIPIDPDFLASLQARGFERLGITLASDYQTDMYGCAPEPEGGRLGLFLVMAEKGELVSTAYLTRREIEAAHHLVTTNIDPNNEETFHG